MWYGTESPKPSFNQAYPNRVPYVPIYKMLFLNYSFFISLKNIVSQTRVSNLNLVFRIVVPVLTN
jgi:hypothetical protein